MFLQSLYNNYDTIIEQTRGITDEIPCGYEFCKYHWKVSLFSDDPKRIVFLPFMNEKGQAVETLLLPNISRSGVKPPANYLSDKATYCLKVNGLEKDLNVEPKHRDFLDKLVYLYDETKSQSVFTILNFLKTYDFANIPQNILADHRIVFEVDNSLDYITDISIVSAINKTNDADEENNDICFISGKPCNSIDIYKSNIKKLPGSVQSGYSLISNNDEVYSSYGLDGWKIFPISKEAAQKVYLALNSLLSSTNHSHNFKKLAFVWYAKENIDIPFLQDPKLIKDFLTAYDNGNIFTNRTLKKTDAFKLFCLKTNYARIALEFPHITTVGEFYEKQHEWLKNTSFVVKGEEKNFPMWAFVNLFDKMPFENHLFQSAFFGQDLPLILVNYLVGLIRSKLLKSFKYEKKDHFAALGLLKYHCFRKYGFNMETDENNYDVPFTLGRIFAEYQALQYEINPKVNGSITSQYLDNASSTPQQIFRILSINAQKHLDYLRRSENKFPAYLAISRRIDKLNSQINDVPRNLNISEQAKFMLGLYFQNNLIDQNRIKHSQFKENKNGIQS